MLHYFCAVVEVSSGRFEVTPPEEVDLGARRRVYEGLNMKIIYPKGEQGRYALHPHLLVEHTSRTVGRCSQDVSTIVGNLSEPLTLNDIYLNLDQAGFAVRSIPAEKK